jgi:hypothetical protein
MRRTLAFIPLIAFGLCSPASARPETSGKGLPPPRAGIGLAAATALPEGLKSAAPETPCWVAFVARRASLDDPSGLKALLEEARGRGLKTLVRLEEADGDAGGTAWTDRLLGFAAALGDRVDAYQLLGAEAGQMAARDYAFLLKNARVSIRAGGSNAIIVSPPLDLLEKIWPDELFAEDAAPYLDVLAAADPATLDRTETVREHWHPRAPVWITDAPLPAEGAASVAISGYLEAVSAGVEVVIFRPAPESPMPPEPSSAPAAEPAPPAGDAEGQADATAPGGAAAQSTPALPGSEDQSSAEGTSAAAAPAKPAPPPLGEILSYVRSLFPPGLRPAAKGALPFDPAAAVAGSATGAQAEEENGNGSAPGAGAATAPDAKTPVPAEIVVLPFFDAQTRDGLAAFRSAADAPPPAIRLPLRSPVESLELITPERMHERKLSEAAGPGATVILPLRPGYRLLRYRLAVEAIPVKESTDVGASAELTAEEIIAFERERRGVQDARVDHYEAKAIINVHYRLASINTTLDLSNESRLYVHDGKEDYEQKALYVNGAKWSSQEPPALPFLQPDEVGEAPLDIALDERYRYTLEGRNTVDGRDCYVLSFEPVDPTQSLYKGKVYIDSTLFTRVRMESVQTALHPPLRSTETVYRYGPIESDVGEVWLPVNIDGQMVYELLGYTLTLERERTFSDFEVNKPGIEERVAQAFDSGRPIYRDTGNGLQRVRIVDGQEELDSLDKPKNTALVFGFSAGESGDLSFPFAGVNFFDFNFRGTGTQFNLAIAGPFADISWNQPNVLSGMVTKPWSFALQGSLTAIELEDEIATFAGTPAEDRVDILSESFRATLSIPMGEFLRWSIQGRGLYQNFDRQDKTSVDFVLPPTHVEGVANLRLEFARLGYQVAPWAEWGTRSDWGPWGRCADVPLEDCTVPGSRFSEDDRDFTRLGIDIRKSYYFGIFHKITLGLSGFEGRSLDRFSRFELGDFRSANVRGFNSSGLHFDRGLVGEASYAFGISKALRAELGLEEGIILSEDDFPDGYERVIGSGLNLEFSGPWGTFVTVRIGAALNSTIPDKGSGADMRVVFFKTWDKWSRHGGKGTPPSGPPAAPGPMQPDPVPIDPDR